MRRLSVPGYLLLAGLVLIGLQWMVWGESFWDLLFPFPGLCLCVASAALVAQRRRAIAVWVLVGLAVVPVAVVAAMAAFWQADSSHLPEDTESLALLLTGLGLAVQSMLLAVLFGVVYVVARWRARQRSFVSPAC